MNITFIAPPAAGKGALSKKIEEKYGYPHVSIGDLLRNVEDEEIKRELEAGAFVSNDIVAKLLIDRLSKDDCKNGYVLDGFPRNESQIEIYEQIREGSKGDHTIIVIDIPRSVGEKRITGRRVCSNCGTVYNVNFDESKPKEEGICDKCGSELSHRTDDNLDTYIHRYDVYENETAPIIDYYKDSEELHFVDGTRSLEEVFDDICEIIEAGL